jgi:hypothetical protein
MSREEALKWIKRNWKKLIADNKLDKALSNYAQAYLVVDAGVKIVQEVDPTDIFNGLLL